jgi:hypothetical protein
MRKLVACAPNEETLARSQYQSTRDLNFRIARFLFGRRKGSASTKIQSGPEVPL